MCHILLPSQILLLAGYIRHALRPNKTIYKPQNLFTRLIYPMGIIIMLFSLILLGFWGWQGAASIGIWPLGLVVATLTILLLWLRPRIRVLNPKQAHWLKPGTTAGGLDYIYNAFWSIYNILRSLSRQISNILESDGGLLWSLLFIIIFASLLSGGIR